MLTAQHVVGVSKTVGSKNRSVTCRFAPSRFVNRTPHTRVPAHSFAHMHLLGSSGSRCCSACLIKTCSSTCRHVSERSLSLHPLISSSLSSVSTSCPISSPPSAHPPCGRNRRVQEPLRVRSMRSMALWRCKTLSQVMSPSSSTIWTTQRLIQ